MKKISAFGGKCQCLSPSVCCHKQNIGKNVLLIVTNVLFFYIFDYLYYPMKFERKFSKGPPLAPPCFEKSGPPAEKKIGPPPLGFWSSPTYDHHFDLSLLALGPSRNPHKKVFELREQTLEIRPYNFRSLHSFTSPRPQRRTLGLRTVPHEAARGLEELYRTLRA